LTRLAIAAPEGATNLSPVSSSITRVTKEGTVEVINILLGSHYKMTMDGILTITSTGDIINDSVTSTSSKLEIAGESNDGLEITKEASFSSFMYFYPKLKIFGHNEIQDDDVGSGPVPVQRMRYVFEDLSTGDKLRIDLEGGDGNAVFTLREVVDSVETDLATLQVPAGETEIHWELRFLEEGVTKLFYRLAGDTDITKLWSGALTARLAECKCTAKLMLDQQATKTVKSDYMFITYPSAAVSYEVPLTTRLVGECVLYDTNNDADEANWSKVRSRDHSFTGECVMENAIIRVWFDKDSPANIKVYGWDPAASGGAGAWVYTCSIIPISVTGDPANILQSLVFERFNNSQIRLTARFGTVDYVITLNRGHPYIGLFSEKYFRIETTKQRFALSVATPATQIQDFNQLKSDDVNRGNPLNLSSPVTTFTFTNDSNVDTGLGLVNDGWYAFYNLTATDCVGWVAPLREVIGLTVSAVSATELDTINWTFASSTIIGIGVLPSTPTALINNIPRPFHVGSQDEYVKWRANESMWTLAQRQSIRKKR